MRLLGLLIIAPLAASWAADAPSQADADRIWRASQQSGICALHHVRLKPHTVTYYMRMPPPDLHVKEYALMEREYPNVRDAVDDRFRPQHFPCKITVGVCPVCQKHFDEELPLLFIKTLQRSPFEISGPRESHGLSREDVRQIELLVSQRSDIRKPILRMWAGRSDHVQIVTGHDAHPGELYNWFDVEKRSGRWAIVPPINDSRNLDERTGIMRQ